MVLAAVLVCGGCAVRRVPLGAGPPFLRAAGMARLSDLRALSAPGWSPDGRLLAFSTADEVWTIRTDGDRRPQRFATVRGVERVAWSPDGRTLAMLSGGRLLALAPGDASPRTLVSDGRVRAFAWAPESAGARLAYVASGGGETALWMLRIAAQTTGQTGTAARLGALPGDIDVHGLVWVPGDAGLAVAAGRSAGAPSQVFWRPQRPRAAFRVQTLDGRDASPSPDGRLIAYLEPAGGHGESYVAVIRADDSGRRRLTPAGQYTGLAWSPSGTMLAFARSAGTRMILEVTDALTGIRLTIGDYVPEIGSAAAPLAIAWAPDGTRLAFGTDTGQATGFVWVAALERR